MNPSQGQTPLDYLNQIAPQAPKRKLFELNLKNVIIFGVIAVVFVSLLGLILSSVGGGAKDNWQRLSLRINTTAQIAETARPYIKDSALRTLNSDLKIALTSAQRDISPILTNLEIDTKKMSPTITAEESGEDISIALEDGRLNAIYDSTYAREMTYQVSTLLILLTDLHSNTSSSSSKEYLQTTYNNILPTYESLEKYSTSNE